MQGLDLKLKLKNKNMKTKLILLAITMMFAITGMQAQEKKNKKKTELVTVEIMTSAVCGMCKDRLEHDIAFEKGVKFVELDKETKILTIKYKEGKNTKEKLKIAVTKVGYDADDLIAEEKAYNALPDCCKKDVAPH